MTARSVDLTDTTGAVPDGDGELRITDVTVEYRSGDETVRPVDGFSAAAADGSLALLLGPSGCGKTTLLSCLAGILRPTAGVITHRGRDITALSGSALTDFRRHGVGIVFQAFNLVPSLTALDNVMLPLRTAGTSVRASRARAEELLADMDLTDRASHLPSQLSGGQQQRVAIARALALDPPLVLADEPTAHLDYVQVEITLRTLRRLAAPGRVVVVVTHDDRLLPLADEVIELVPHRPVRIMDPEVEVTLRDGDLLFRQGDASDRIYLIEEGEVDIVRQAPDREPETIATLGPGECFGEMGPLFDLPRSATARARGATRVKGYTPAALREELGVDFLQGLVRGR
jgi:putative ABC transport system ATP-binding protein